MLRAREAVGRTKRRSGGMPGSAGGARYRRRMSRAVAGSTEDGVRQYLQELGAHSLLTGDDEVRLGEAMAAGRQAATELGYGEDVGLADDRRSVLVDLVRVGDEARTRFIAANLRLVVSIAKRYQTSGL